MSVYLLAVSRPVSRGNPCGILNALEWLLQVEQRLRQLEDRALASESSQMGNKAQPGPYSSQRQSGNPALLSVPRTYNPDADIVVPKVWRALRPVFLLEWQGAWPEVLGPTQENGTVAGSADLKKSKKKKEKGASAQTEVAATAQQIEEKPKKKKRKAEVAADAPDARPNGTAEKVCLP